MADRPTATGIFNVCKEENVTDVDGKLEALRPVVILHCLL